MQELNILERDKQKYHEYVEGQREHRQSVTKNAHYNKDLE